MASGNATPATMPFRPVAHNRRMHRLFLARLLATVRLAGTEFFCGLFLIALSMSSYASDDGVSGAAADVIDIDDLVYGAACLAGGFLVGWAFRQSRQRGE